MAKDTHVCGRGAACGTCARGLVKYSHVTTRRRPTLDSLQGVGLPGVDVCVWGWEGGGMALLIIVIFMMKPLLHKFSVL